MKQAIELNDLDDWYKLLKISNHSPILIFKSSPICPVSHYAESEFLHYLQECPEQLKAYSVNVIGNRNISKQIAADMEVTHQSPQVLLILREKCVWNTSHSSINVDELRANVKFDI